MIGTTFPLLLAAFGATASAQLLARLVPQELSQRAPRAPGGLALRPELGGFCSNDLLSISGGSACCPMSLPSAGVVGGSWVCCPENQDCSGALGIAPYCADDTWQLWDETRGGINENGYFCCASGLIGLLNGDCIDPATLSSPTLEAMAMAPGGAPETTTVATATVVSVSTGVSTITTTSVSAATATTGVVVTAGNSSVSKMSTSTKSASTLSSVTPVVLLTASSAPTSSSVQPSTTKTSGGNAFAAGSVWLLPGAFALFIGAAI